MRWPLHRSTIMCWRSAPMRGRPARRSLVDVAARRSANRCMRISVTVAPNSSFAWASLSQTARSDLESKASSNVLALPVRLDSPTCVTHASRVEFARSTRNVSAKVGSAQGHVAARFAELFAAASVSTSTTRTVCIPHYSRPKITE